MLAIWSLVPLPFLNPTWTSGSSQFTYCWSLAWRILSITLLACEMGTILRQFLCYFALPFFGIGMKTDLFQSCGHCWVFQICWHIECSSLTASSLRIWNSSTGIPSLPLVLFIVRSVHWMHETSAQGWCPGMTQRDGMGREVGGGFRMGNTCKSMVDSCQCMAKTTTIL